MSLHDDLLAQVKNPSQEFKALLCRLAREHPEEAREAVEAIWSANAGPQADGYHTLADETFYGGQAGGGKTDLGIGLAITAHRRSLILRRFNKDAVKLVERMEAIVGHRNGYNGQLQRWKFQDRSNTRLIEFGGCEQESDKQRYKGDPHDLIVFDEGSDFFESQYVFIIGWNRSADPAQRCRVVVTSNPPTTASGLWVIKRWAAWLDPNHPKPATQGELRWYTTVDGIDTEVDGPGPHDVGGELVMARSRTYIPAALSDNPDLDKRTVVLPDGTEVVVPGVYHSVLAGLPEELRRAYRDGDWSVGQKDDDYQVIPTAWIEAAMQRWTDKVPRTGMTAMAVDVAPGGGDQRVICWRYDGWYAPFVAEKVVDKTGRLTASEVVKHRRNHCPVVVDLGGGWGGDALIAMKDNGIEVVAFNGVQASHGRTRDGKIKFRNKRAEATWKFREALDPSQEGGSVVALPGDAELKADLASYRWENTLNGILIEDKEKMRERLGRSPDKGDAAIMCLSEGARAVERMGRVGRNVIPLKANIGGRQLATVRR